MSSVIDAHTKLGQLLAELLKERDELRRELEGLKMLQTDTCALLKQFRGERDELRAALRVVWASRESMNGEHDPLDQVTIDLVERLFSEGEPTT